MNRLDAPRNKSSIITAGGGKMSGRVIVPIIVESSIHYMGTVATVGPSWGMLDNTGVIEQLQGAEVVCCCQQARFFTHINRIDIRAVRTRRPYPHCFETQHHSVGSPALVHGGSSDLFPSLTAPEQQFIGTAGGAQHPVVVTEVNVGDISIMPLESTQQFQVVGVAR